jgi:hypothetical protein
MRARIVAVIFWLWLLGWIVLLITASVQSALAHGDAEWIMREPRYVDRNGVHCCGPSDCGVVPDSEIAEDNETISHRGEKLNKSDRGSYWSIDHQHWVCRRFDGLKCIFRPMPGS